MQKNNQAKKLYQFSKKQKNKLSASTKDLNDSLDNVTADIVACKNHQRTYSCPSVAPQDLQEIEIQPKEQTARSYKLKPTHRNCQSQVELDTISVNQHSISIDNLSAILYRKNSKESLLKKSRVSGSSKFQPVNFNRDHY
jgi:hypothetical protein